MAPTDGHRAEGDEAAMPDDGYLPQLYDVDIALVVDASASMGPFLDDLVRAGTGLSELVLPPEERRSKFVGSVRVRVVAFRDLTDDRSPGIEASPFFDVPAGEGALASHLRSITAGPASTRPGSGMAALAVAFAPDSGVWKTILERWDSVCWYPVAAGDGLRELRTIEPSDVGQLRDFAMGSI